MPRTLSQKLKSQGLKEVSSIISQISVTAFNISVLLKVHDIIILLGFIFCVLGFSGDSDGKQSVCNAEEPGSIPGSGRSPGEGNGNPLQYSCLENSMDRRAWWATVHGVAKNWTQLRDFHLTLYQLNFVQKYVKTATNTYDITFS